MSKGAKIILFIITAAIAAALILYYSVVFKKTGPPVQNENTSQNSGQPSSTSTSSGETTSTSNKALLLAPIDNWRARETKKPFGIYITPKNSPVSPERFTGYHTGVDFEIFSEEQNIEVPIFAVCSGPLVLKQFGSGYGGMINQRCQLEGQDISVTYGHLRLSSIEKNVGQELAAGEKIGVLGTGFSPETDGERKHLHLGIHKGKTAFTRGYVATQKELSDWIDITIYLK